MAVTFFSCFNDFGCGDIFHALRFQKCVCGSRGITVTKSFRFHFSGHQRLTIFVFELQSDGGKRRLSTVWQILKFLRE